MKTSEFTNQGQEKAKTSRSSTPLSTAKHMPQEVLGLQPAAEPGKMTAGAFASFIPHHANHITTLLSAAPVTTLADPTSPSYMGHRAVSKYPASDCSQ